MCALSTRERQPHTVDLIWRNSPKMKVSTVNTNISLRIKQGIVLFVLILLGIILSVAVEAKGNSSRDDHRISSIRKQNKRYADACELLKEKRNKKEKAKVYKRKYR